MKKRILVFSDYFKPGFKAGGPIKSVFNLVSRLGSYFEILVVTRNFDFGDSTPYENIQCNKIINTSHFKTIYIDKVSFRNCLSIVTDYKPNIIHLNSFFSTFTIIALCLRKLNKIECPLIISPRGELQTNALSIKPIKKKYLIRIFKFFNIYNNIFFHSTDIVETKEIEKKFNAKVFKISNLPSSSSSIVSEWKQKHEPLKIIFVARIRENKNLLYAIEVLRQIQNVKIIFNVYGIIEDEAYWNKCLSTAASLSSNVQFDYCGSINYDQVLKTMSKYHVLLFPTLTENFGHVIVEAMQIGLIPVISDNTPWKDLEKKGAGWSLSLDEKRSFSNTIIKISNYDKNQYLKQSKNVRNYFNRSLNIKDIEKKYKIMFNSVLE